MNRSILLAFLAASVIVVNASDSLLAQGFGDDDNLYIPPKLTVDNRIGTSVLDEREC